MKKTFIFSVVSVVILYSIAFAGGFKTGLWEIKTDTTIEGMPIKMPTQTMQTCIKSDKYIPGEEEKNPNCKMVYNKVEGNKTNWKIVCKEGGTTIETVGSMTATAKNFKSQSETIVTEGNTKQITKINMNGTYLGPCK